MPTTYAMREAPTPNDVKAVERITASTGFFRPDEIEVAVELVEERLAKGEESGYYFRFLDSADRPGCAVAYVCFGPTPCTLGAFDLYWIAVDADSQGAGLGRRLVDAAERGAEALGGRKMYIETSGLELYRPTQDFYKRMGYREAARLADFYNVGDDKLIFEKDLRQDPVAKS